MTLAELQARFWKLISAPVPVEQVLPEVAGAAPLTSWIRAVDEATATERLNVYANMYFFRLLGVLRDDYPKLVKLVGDPAFHDLVTDYLVAFPSDNPSIRHVGRHLAGFLASHALESAHPGAADLASLEWERGTSFDAADGAELSAAQLAAIPADRWGALRFELVPSFSSLRLGYPVHLLWQAIEDGRDPPALAPATTEVITWRRGFTVYHRTAAAGELPLLEALRRGASFGEVCEDLDRSHGDDTVPAAFRLLKTWIDQGVLSGMAS